MSRLLVSLVSPKSGLGGLAVFDTKAGVSYLQIDSPSPLVSKPFVRGLAIHNDLAYVTTPASLRIYKFACKEGQPLLQLQKEIVLNDWLLGTTMQADLVPVCISEKRKRIFIGNSSRCSLDELDLDGCFVRRRSLWEIAPEIFYAPLKIVKNFSFGRIRCISETENGSIFLIVSNCNNSGEGKVINLDNGGEVLSGLHDPHGGVVGRNCYYFYDTASGGYRASLKNGVLSSFSIEQNHTDCLGELRWMTELAGTVFEREETSQNLRGIALADETLYCGVGHFGKHSKGNVPHRIIAFNAGTGHQVKEFTLPDLVGFPQPRVIFMEAIPDAVIFSLPDTLTFFLYNRQVEPQYARHSEEDSYAQKQNGPAQTPDQQAPKKLVTVSLDYVSLFYRRSAGFFLSLNKKMRTLREFWALRDVCLNLYEGQTVGLIGRNGSGKSTMSKLISGALPPDKGTVVTAGKVHLLALGIGFRPVMSGRENVFISGTLLGLTRRQVAERMVEIEEFAELGSFFDEPVRTYSSGMKSRLGFAVSTAVNPDILILDEVLSVGDAEFREKANQRMRAMRERTKTVIIVSHNMSQLKQLCSRIVWLEKGRLLMDGKPKAVLPAYDKFCKNPDKWLADHPQMAALLTDP